MQLHQLNQLAYPSTIEDAWINSIHPGDTILLIEEAILRCQIQHHSLRETIESKDALLFYLESDALAYGINPRLGTALTNEEWVNITLTADSNISW